MRWNNAAGCLLGAVAMILLCWIGEGLIVATIGNPQRDFTDLNSWQSPAYVPTAVTGVADLPKSVKRGVFLLGDENIGGKVLLTPLTHAASNRLTTKRGDVQAYDFSTSSLATEGFDTTYVAVSGMVNPVPMVGQYALVTPVEGRLGAMRLSETTWTLFAADYDKATRIGYEWQFKRDGFDWAKRAQWRKVLMGEAANIGEGRRVNLHLGDLVWQEFTLGFTTARGGAGGLWVIYDIANRVPYAVVRVEN